MSDDDYLEEEEDEFQGPKIGVKLQCSDSLTIFRLTKEKETKRSKEMVKEKQYYPMEILTKENI